MKGVILYQSKYGATKKYVDWLSEATGFSCIETKKAKIMELKEYDVIILGGGIYAFSIAGLSFLKKHADSLIDKKLAVFCCGASPYEEQAFKEIRKHNMRGRISEVPLFYCRGAWDMEAMTPMHRTMCKMLRKSVSKKDPDEYEVWEKALMAAGDNKCDWTDKSYLDPILEFIKQ